MAEKSGVGVVIVLALLLIGLLFVLPILGMGMMMRGGMMGGWGVWEYPGWAGWGFMLVGILLPLLFVALLIIGAYFVLTHWEHTGEDDRSLSILNERYAKGEITEKQYLQMKEQLSKK